MNKIYLLFLIVGINFTTYCMQKNKPENYYKQFRLSNFFKKFWSPTDQMEIKTSPHDKDLALKVQRLLDLIFIRVPIVKKREAGKTKKLITDGERSSQIFIYDSIIVKIAEIFDLTIPPSEQKLLASTNGSSTPESSQITSAENNIGLRIYNNLWELVKEQKGDFTYQEVTLTQNNREYKHAHKKLIKAVLQQYTFNPDTFEIEATLGFDHLKAAAPWAFEAHKREIKQRIKAKKRVSWYNSKPAWCIYSITGTLGAVYLWNLVKQKWQHS